MSSNRQVYLGKSAIWTGLGFGLTDNYNSMLNGEHGLNPIDVAPQGELTRLETMMVRVINAVTDEVDLTSARTAFVFSTTKGNIDNLTIDTPKPQSNVFLQNMAHHVCKIVGFTGNPIVVSNACISGVVAVVVAQRLIRTGVFDNVIVVGGDEMTEFTTSGFMAFKSVSPNPCRPYDAQRDGLSLGEAVGAIVITADETKSAGVVLAGSAMTNDANHISGPSRTGEPLAEAMKQAMTEAQLTSADISFVNAHGTATIYNDEMESKAMALAELQQCPINSLKPYIGHTLGASGVVEIAIAAEELRRGVLLGTKGYETPGTPIPLNVSAANRSIEMRHCIKSASGFGGCNAAVVMSLAKYATIAQPLQAAQSVVMKQCTMKAGKLTVDNKVLMQTASDFSAFAREMYHTLTPNLKFFKMTDMCKLGYLAAEYMLSNLEYEPYDVAMVLSNRSSSLDADLQHWRIQKRDNEPASPAAFVYTLPNIVMGEIAIKHKVKGETTFFVANDKNDNFATHYAEMLLGSGRYKYVLTGWCELLDNEYELDFKLITTNK